MESSAIPQKSGGFNQIRRDWIEPILIAFLLAALIRTFIIQPFKIPSCSMEDTLMVGDQLVAVKFLYGTKIPFTKIIIFKFRNPKPGDVIVFKYPEDPSKDFIKRCIAVGGQTLEIRNKEIGFVFQFYHLLPEFTALENVMMPALCKGARRAACMPRAVELLTKVGLEERITHKPGQLSGGEQQRVAIARALFNNPSLVLADEPTGNLDERTGEGITELLWRLNATDGITLVIVSHDEQFAAKAHRWVHLHEGLAIPRKG
jgi:ABC-type ATPase involved in cell division